MRLTPWSPAVPKKSADKPRVFELRTYTTNPGKLPNINICVAKCQAITYLMLKCFITHNKPAVVFTRAFVAVAPRFKMMQFDKQINYEATTVDTLA